MIRLRIILITIGCIVVLIGLLYTVSAQILRDSYVEIEEAQMVRNLERVDYAISNYANSLTIKLRDWAEWDDTYNFINNPDGDFIDVNLGDTTLINLEINLIAFTDNDGNVVYSKYVDLSTNSEVASENIMAAIKQSNLSAQSDGRITGVIPAEDNLLILEGLPILQSDGEGPALGTVYFGKFVDKTFVTSIEDLTRLDVTIEQIAQKVVAEKTYTVDEKTSTLIEGYFFLINASGNAIAKISVSYPRTIYAQGQNTIAIFSIISSVTILLFGIVILTVFEILLLRRLLKLSKEVDSISVNNLENTRIKEGTNDELGKLSRTINHLLDEIARAQKKEHDAAQLEMVANEKLKRSLQASENMNKLMVGRELKMAELKEKLAAMEQNKL